MKFLDKYDLIVVGAGIAGLATAYFYKRKFPNHSVLVLERRNVGAGLTGRSGGHRMPGFEADHSEVAKLLGERAALELYEETIRASELTDKIIAEEGMKCGNHSGYWIVDEHEREFAKLDEFMKPRRALKLSEPQFYSGPELRKHVDFQGYNAGLYFPDIASFDTPKFIYGLADAFRRHGGHIAEGYEYDDHKETKPDKSGKQKGKGTKRYAVELAGGQVLYTDRLVLAGGDILSRKLPFLHKRTATVYTGRMGVRLKREHARLISPQAFPLAGCDSDLKSNQNPLEGDFLWFSLRQDGYLAMGFGGCFGSINPDSTHDAIDAMVAEVRRELYKRLPFLAQGDYRIKPTVGGLNTSSNLLPIIGPISHEEGVVAIAAQSGVGLNQSILMATALVGFYAGDRRIYDLLTRFAHGQVIMPTSRTLRRAALEIGVLEKSSDWSAVRTACSTAHNLATIYTRARTPFERSEL